MDQGGVKLQSAVREVRQGKLKPLLSLLELGASPEEVAELVIEVLELGNYLGLKKSYSSYESPPLREICDLVSENRFSPHRARLARAMMSLLRAMEKERYWDREVLIETVGKIGGDDLLPDLVFELDRERAQVEGRYGSTLEDKRHSEERLARLEQATLARFDAELVGEIRALIDILDGLPRDKGWGHNDPLSEQKRFLRRRDSARWLKHRQNLLLFCLRFMLERYAEVEDDVVTIVGSALARKNLKRLRELAEQDRDEEVRLRARIILANRDGTFTRELVPRGGFSNVSHTLAYYNGVMASRGRAYAGHTWIKDETVERIIHDAFRKTDDSFSRFFTEQVGKHEPPLTERLVTIMESEFEPVQGVIEAWGRDLTAGRVRIEFSHRDTQPQEDEWHADIAFLLNCSLESEFIKKHAILVQSKKMNHDTGTGRFSQSWTIDIAQCRDLIARTPFGYYFLYGPHEYPSVKTLVVPATTLIGIIDATAKPGQESKNIRYEDVRHSSRSLADFMLYDFIGCWVGDIDSEVVSVAEGGGAVRPAARHVVTVTIVRGRDLQ